MSSFRQCLGRPLSGHQGPFCSEVGGGDLPLAVSGLTHATMWKGRTVANWSHRALFGPRMDLSLMSERTLFHITPREHSLLRATLLQKISLLLRFSWWTQSSRGRSALFLRAKQSPLRDSGSPSLCAEEAFALGLR